MIIGFLSDRQNENNFVFKELHYSIIPMIFLKNTYMKLFQKQSKLQIEKYLHIVQYVQFIIYDSSYINELTLNVHERMFKTLFTVCYEKW